MRVSQLQNVTWAGNVLVLAGLVWVGVQFKDALKLKAAKDLKWDVQKAAADGPRWPGDLAGFAHIWTTPINGKVPPPPPPPSTQVKQVDEIAEFKGKIKYLGAFDFLRQPDKTTARVSFEGKELGITPGCSIGGFQFVEVSLDDAKKTAKLSFRDPKKGVVFSVEQTVPQTPALTDPSHPPFTPGYDNRVQPGRVTEKGPLDLQSYPVPSTGEWIITTDELEWIEEFYEKDVWAGLKAEPDVDAQGVSRGVKILSPLEMLPLATSHGVGTGDVVRAINDVPMTSKDDILAYLRGKGRGLEKYVVTVDSGGKSRTVVYRVQRRP